MLLTATVSLGLGLQAPPRTPLGTRSPVGLRSPSPVAASPPLARRGVLVLPALLVLAATTRPPPASAAAAPVVSEELRLLIVKAKALKGGVRAGAASRRKLPLDPTPGVNNYASLTDRVRREQASVLVPLQAAMAAAAAAAGGSGRLPDDVQKQLALQPELLKGHLSELDYYLAKANFAEYVSKTTGETYPGGKVERELEEVCDTADDFLALAAGRAVPVRPD